MKEYLAIVIFFPRTLRHPTHKIRLYEGFAKYLKPKYIQHNLRQATAMKGFVMLKKIWDYDFSKSNLPDLKYVWIFIAAYSVYEGLLFQVPKGFFALYDDYITLHPELEWLRSGSYVIAILLGILLFWFVRINENAAAKTIGEQRMRAIALPHLLTSVLDMLVVVLMIFVIQSVIEGMTGRPFSLIGLLDLSDDQHPFKALIDAYNTAIPTYLELPYLVAFMVTIILADLPIYVFHYLVHHSRLLWYTIHRSHHSPEYLHPFGLGPVFAFGFLFVVPAFLFKLALSKMFYPEPLLGGLLIFHIVLFVTEKFNHSSAFYHIPFSNKYIYQIFRFFGNGPYHMAHHSAREGEEIVNLANLGFNFWDRLFGTFREPDHSIPPLGLTNQPKIKLNPFRLYFGGFCTITYELRHNPARYWLKIVFGSVYFTPPVTKDYLIESYPVQMTASQ